MAKKKVIACGVDIGDMRPFPVCCSVKNLASLGARNAYAAGKGDNIAPRVKAAIPANIRSLDGVALQRLQRLPATLRAWPVRIWYSFILQTLVTKRMTGQGGGDGYRTKTFVVADNVGGKRLHERGSGFAEWCKRVPGVKVTSSGDFPGAHGGMCRAYFITIMDGPKAQSFLRKSKDMVNTRLTRLRSSPARQRYRSNVTQREMAAQQGRDGRGFRLERHW
jgi:hypothetical protein